MSTENQLAPEFKTEEEEAEHWDTHSPLDSIAEPTARRVQTRCAKDRPITIRLDTNTRAKLDRLAAVKGLGPSTLARLILVNEIDRSTPVVKKTLEEVVEAMERNLPQETKDKMESLVKGLTIGDPPYLLELTDKAKVDEFARFVMALFLSLADIQLAAPESEQTYKQRRSAASLNPANAESAA